MSISQLFPEEGPTLNLNFAGSRTLDPRITFTRTSTGTYMGSDGLIKVASANSPRFDHRYVNGEIESLGLLIEESRVNSLRYSNDFSQNNWTKQNSHPVPTQDVVGPDGVSNSGWRFYRTATNQYLYQGVGGAGTHTLSVWVKSSAATGSFTMQAYNGTDAGMTQQFTATNEWQRFSITISPTTTTSYYPCVPTNTNEDFYVWGAQLEQNSSFPTSYIPTSGSAATRTADNASMTGSNFSSWYNQSEGTFYASSIKNGMGGSNFYGIMFVDDGTNANAMGFSIDDVSTDNISFSIIKSSGTQTGFTVHSSIQSGINYKLIFAYEENNTSIVNGSGSILTDSTVSIPTVNRLILGNLRGSVINEQKLNGTISQLTYYPTRLPNSQLQALTR